MPLLDAAAARCHYDRRRRSTVARPLDRAAHRHAWSRQSSVRASRQIALSMRLLAVHPRLPVRVPCAPRVCPVHTLIYHLFSVFAPRVSTAYTAV